MSLREEFVGFASRPDANVALLCRRFGVSRKTGYKWLSRAAAAAAAAAEIGGGGGGGDALASRSRRPARSPSRTGADVEQRIVALRLAHPAWGARKIKRRLEDLGDAGVPARSTVNQVLLRRGLIPPAASRQHAATQRFERAAPNELWQMDFKGHFATGAGRCHPLTVLDDHSRYNLLLLACDTERLDVVRGGLVDTMRRYGMPQAILADNGPPWGSFGQDGNWTTLGAWLLRRGVTVLHGRPNHPQTQGKEERFHRTLKAEALGSRSFRDNLHCQEVFDGWRTVYNSQRPHESLGLATPATRYAPSARPFPEALAPIEYGPGDAVRRVCAKGTVSYRGSAHRVGKAFVGEPVAVRPTTDDGRMGVYYCHQRVAEIDLRGQSHNG